MSLTKITSEGIEDGSIVNADLHSSAAIAHSKLANSGVSAGSYGSATAIPALTINAQGLVTAASTNTVNTTTNLGISTATDSVTVTSSTGNNAQINEASSSAAGVMSVAHHDKLDGIEASATADQTASEIVALIANQTIAPSEIDMEDNEKIKLGTGDDLQIFHNGSSSLIQDNSNELFIRANAAIKLENNDGSETIAKFHENGNCELYHDNTKRFETTNGGASVTGTLSCSSNFTASGASNSLGNTTINGGGGAGGIAFTIDFNGTDVFKVNNVGSITLNGTVDGRDIAADGSKLDGIAAGANVGNTIIGTDSDINTSGATVIDQLNMTDGVITSHSTRTLTLANLGYTGATNANRITNNNQISNGAGYMSGSTSQLAKAFVNYNGNNNSIRNDFNVSSISDHGNGDQTVNFSSSISMSYTVCGMPIAHDTGGTRCTNAIRGSSSSGPTRMNSTGVRINRGFGSHNAFQDGHTMCVAIFRP